MSYRAPKDFFSLIRIFGKHGFYGQGFLEYCFDNYGNGYFQFY